MSSCLPLEMSDTYFIHAVDVTRIDNITFFTICTNIFERFLLLELNQLLCSCNCSLDACLLQVVPHLSAWKAWLPCFMCNNGDIATDSSQKGQITRHHWCRRWLSVFKACCIEIHTQPKQLILFLQHSIIFGKVGCCNQHVFVNCLKLKLLCNKATSQN